MIALFITGSLQSNSIIPIISNEIERRPVKTKDFCFVPNGIPPDSDNSYNLKTQRYHLYKNTLLLPPHSLHFCSDRIHITLYTILTEYRLSRSHFSLSEGAKLYLYLVVRIVGCKLDIRSAALLS